MATIERHEPRERKKRNLLPSLRTEHPFTLFQEHVSPLFDDFFAGTKMMPFQRAEFLQGDFIPRVDVKENDKEMTVSVELPGMDEKDIEVLLSGDSLTIKGEKKEEKEEKEENFYRLERHYGTFRRVIPLPVEIDTKKAEASFKKGILHIKLAKTAQAKEAVKKIPVKSEG